MLNRFTKLIPLFILVLALASCGQRDLPTDRPLDDGSYFYRNNTLGFSLVLPETFEYYQTQRTSGDAYVDVEFFVPTSDITFGRQVQGYAKPIIVRVYEKQKWQEVGENSEFRKIGENSDSVYTINFWEEEPEDWQEIWYGEIEEDIINSFEVE